MNGNASKYTTPMDKSSDNISFINYLKNFFPVFNEFSFTDNYLVFENNKLSLQGFDIKEIFYDSANSFYKHLREDLLSAKKIFRIFRVYENKNMYFEYENKFYENFGSDADFVDRYNEYFYNLMLFFEYLTEELKRFLNDFRKDNCYSLIKAYFAIDTLKKDYDYTFTTLGLRMIFFSSFTFSFA